MKTRFLLLCQLAIAWLIVTAMLPLSAMAQDFTPDLFPGQSSHREDLEITATVNVGEFGQATNMKSWVQNLTSSNQDVVMTYNQNGYTAVLIVGVGEADVTYTETMFNGDDAGGGASGGGGADGGTTGGVTTNHIIHYKVIKGVPTAQYTMNREPVTSARLIWDGVDPYSFTFNAPSLEIIVQEVYLEQNTFPKFRDKYIYERSCTIESTNPAVATAGMRGISPVSFGKTTIRATWAGDDNWVGVSAEYELSVEQPKESIYINFYQRSITGFVGENMSAPMNVSMLTIDSWRSDDPSVASVDAKTGEVTFVSEGTTRIYAVIDETDTHYAAQGYYTVTVKKKDCGLSFSMEEATAELSVPFTPPTLSNPNNLKIEKWYCDNQDVVEVDEATGELTIKAVGNANISCETFGDDTYAAGVASYLLHVTTIGLKVLGVNVTSLNCDDVLGDGSKQVTYDKLTRTLTLNGFNVQANMLSPEIKEAVICHEGTGQLVINVVGVNSIMNAIHCIVSENTPVVIMSTDKDNSLALTATESAICSVAMKVYDSRLYASSNTGAAIDLTSLLSVWKGGYVTAETASTTVSAIRCTSLERGKDDTGGIEILTKDVIFGQKPTGFFGGENHKSPAPYIEIGKVPMVPPLDVQTNIEFGAQDPEGNDYVVFSASANDTFNEETGQLEITTSLTDAQVEEALEELVPGSSEWVKTLPGSIIFDIPAGEGVIKIKCMTMPGFTLQVKREGETAISITQTTFGWAEVAYNVPSPTHVIIYLHASEMVKAYAPATSPEPSGVFIEAIQVAPKGAAPAAAIKDLKLTVNVDGETQIMSIPAADFDPVVLSESFSSMIIEKVEVQTLVDVTDVAFVATMYNADESTPTSMDKWRIIPLESKGKGLWSLELGDNGQLIEKEESNKTKTFEFFVQAKDDTNNDAYYNNGGNNYKVTFNIGEGGGDDAWTVKFYKDETASLGLLVDGSSWNTSYNGDVIRQTGYGWNPGEVQSLMIQDFSVWFIRNDDITIKDVSLQYRVNEEGGSEGTWNRINGTLTSSEDLYNKDKDRTEHYMMYSGSSSDVEVCNGLDPDKNYVLEVMYQIIVTDKDNNEKYVFFGGKEGTRFSFSIGEGTSDVIEQMTVTLTEDGVVTSDYDVKGGSLISKVNQELMLNSFTVNTSEDVDIIRLNYIIYPNEPGGSDGKEFKTVDAQKLFANVWSDNCNINLLAGLESYKSYRFYCYLSYLKDKVWHNSNVELQIDIVTGSLPDGINDVQVKAVKMVPRYNLSGQRVGKDQKGIVIEDGKKILIK